MPLRTSFFLGSATVTGPVDSVNGQTGVVLLDTADIPEASPNFYFTTARFDTEFALKTTDDLTEGVTNLYYTEARVSANTDVAANTAKVSADGSIDTHSDVDTTTTPPSSGQVLEWDGANWVPATPATAPVTSVNTQTGIVVLDTDDIAEGVTNFYYTEARFDTSFGLKDTDDLSEGTTNLYYTSGRFNTDFGLKDTDDLTEGSSNLYYTSARFNTDFGLKDTDDLSEGTTNLYYTEGRVSANTSVVANTAKVSADGSIDTHSDVDTTTTAPVLNDVLLWDGANWVPTAIPSAPVASVNGQTGVVVLDTDDIAEGTTNLYYTQARFDTAFGLKDTDDLSEGAVNFYYTEARFDSSFAFKDTDDLSEGTTNLYYTQARFDTAFGLKDTDDLSEGTTNLYYTEARVSANINVAANTLKVSADGSVGTHSDVDLTGITNGQTLIWSGGTTFVASNMVVSVNGQSGTVTLDSDDITEGTTNLYYTEARFNTSFGAKDTDDLSEGTTNLYYTEARVSANSSVTANTAKVSADGSVDTHNDVDTTTTPPNIGEVLEWDGANWIPAPIPSAPVTSVNSLTGIVVLDTDDIAEGAVNFYYTEARFNSSFSGKDTDDLSEGTTNLYYTEARFNSSFSGKDTDDLSEGTTNLYYTEARVSANSSVTANTAKVSADGSIDTHSDVDTTSTAPSVNDLLAWDGFNWVPVAPYVAPVDSVNGQTGAVVLDTDDIAEGTTNFYYTEGRFDTSFGNKSTDDLVEGITNLYYTEARVSANTSVVANTAKVSADGSIDTHSDVDTTTAAPSSGDTLEWDGSNWVPATPINATVSAQAHLSVFTNYGSSGYSGPIYMNTTIFETDTSIHDPTTSDSGTATGTQTASTLQDTTKTWTVNQFAGYYLRTTGGTGNDRFRKIVSNTANTLTITPNWVVTPDGTTTYEISQKAGRLTAPSDGIYQVTCQLGFEKPIVANTTYGIRFDINGTFKNVMFYNTSTGTEHESVSVREFEMTAGDYIEVQAYQGTGSERKMYGSSRMFVTLTKE